MNEDILKLLDRLYTISFTVNKDLSISRISPALCRLYPGISEGNRLFDMFCCHRPTGVDSYEALKARKYSLFLLIAKPQNLALKVELIDTEEEDSLHFIGMPWLSWISQHAPQVELSLSDFPTLDSQMDQAFYITSQAAMVRDLEALTQKMKEAEEEAKEANRLQSELFAVMSHEMRTPLNGVISALSLLSDTTDENEKTRLNMLADKSAKNLLSVINYALDFSKIDAGRMPLEPDNVDIVKLLDLVVSVSQGRVQEKGLSLSIDIDERLPPRIYADGEKIRQVLINLIGNAIKFTDHGSVSVKLEKADGNTKTLILKISDTGKGIEEKDINHIYEAFWGKKKSDSEMSTGLGLNIVRRLVELMSGEVSVKSTVGSGTTFTVSLPYEESPAEQEEAIAESPAALPDQLEGHVLIVDDNQTNLMLGQMILEKFGIRVRTASNGQEALDIASEVPFDLILMDISMPVMDGRAATELINHFDAPPPVVALSANVSKDLVEKYLSSGFSGYLAKPIDQQALLMELNLWLKPGTSEKDGPDISGMITCNQKTLDQLRTQIGPDNYKKIKSLFMDETRTRLNTLLSAWVRRDLEALRKESHTLASSVSSFGLDDLSWRMKQIEVASKREDIKQIIRHMKNIEHIAMNALDTFDLSGDTNANTEVEI